MPTAERPAPAACLPVYAKLSFAWPVLLMPASTTITFAKNFARSRASPSVAKPCAVSCARPVWALPKSAVLLLIVSAACGSAQLGELVQLDGSPHDWLQERGPRLTALGMQDDATGKILAAQFFPSETALGYLCLLRQLLRRHGVPLAFYGDHSGIFVRNDDFWSVEEQLAGKRQPTQFGRALDQLGITFIAARSPQAKGRVERLWGVLQDRLCSELRLAQAGDLDSANTVLRSFLADYNRRFPRRPREILTAWRPAPENLDRICCFVHQRVVSNDNIVQWEGQRFQIPQQGQRFSFAGAKVQIYQALDGRVSLYSGDTRLQHTLASPG